MTDHASRILFAGVTAITLDPNIGDLHGADILVEDGRIAAIAPNIPIAEGSALVIEGSSLLALPGFVDTHRHNWQSATHGVAADWTHRHYYAGNRGVLGHLFRPQDMYASGLLGMAESLDAGITTTLDWSHNMNTPEHADAVVSALRDSGGRAVLGYGGTNEQWFPVTSTPLSTDARRVREQHFSSDDDLVTMCLAVRGPEASTLEATLHDFAYARELGLRTSVHVGAFHFMHLGTKKDGGAIHTLHAHGLLGPDVTYIHCNSLGDDELRLIADSGGSASVSPEIEMQMEMGFPATGRLLDAGIRPSLSVDVPNAIGASMFGLMRSALQTQRALDNDAAIASGRLMDRIKLTARDVLEFATIQGARALGLEARIGSLAPGKDADIVLMRTDNVVMAPLSNPVGQAVLSGHAGLVEHVLVRGRFVKRDGRLVSVDTSKVIEDASATRDHLFAAAGGLATDGSWIPDSYEGQNVHSAAASA